jgi:hypothetical protein
MSLYELRLQPQFQHLAVATVVNELLVHEIRVTGNFACSLVPPSGLGLIRPHPNMIYQPLNSSSRDKPHQTLHRRLMKYQL